MTPKSLKRYADIIGVISAGLCLLHCIAIPLFFALAIVIPDFRHGNWHFLHYLFIALALLAVHHSASRHRDKTINGMMWGALMVFAMALLLHDVFSWMLIVSAGASLVLMILHMISRSRPPKR